MNTTADRSVLRLLERDASVDELHAYLEKEITEHFGLSSDLRRPATGFGNAQKMVFGQLARN
jgi:hypothetical protein